MFVLRLGCALNFCLIYDGDFGLWIFADVNKPQTSPESYVRQKWSEIPVTVTEILREQTKKKNYFSVNLLNFTFYLMSPSSS